MKERTSFLQFKLNQDLYITSIFKGLFPRVTVPHLLESIDVRRMTQLLEQGSAQPTLSGKNKKVKTSQLSCPS